MKSPIAVLAGAMIPVIGTALLLTPAEAAAADWRLVRQSSYGDSSYYDAASVKSLEGQVVSLRAKLGIAEYQYEMRCGKKEARLIWPGDAGTQDSMWFPIASGSEEEIIYREVCP